MTYGDDTGPPPRHVIINRSRYNLADADSLSKAQRDAILKLAKEYPALDAERIHARLKRDKITVSVNAVAAVLASKGLARGR